MEEKEIIRKIITAIILLIITLIGITLIMLYIV